MNLIKINQKINKSFSSETVIASFVLSIISIRITFKRIIEFFIETFKIMNFNNVRAVIVDEVQKVVNITLYRSSTVLPVNIRINFE